MAEFDDHATVAAALDELTRGLVKKSTGPDGSSVEYFSPSDLIEAGNRAKGNAAAGKSHFGILMTRLVPPGTG